MNKKPATAVSVIIPAFNEAARIRDCLDALALQTVQPLEVLVVDNNSTDQTAALAREYPFVRVLSAPEQGVVFATTTGYDSARGDIIARIDVDSVVPPTWLEHLVSFYAEPSNQRSAWTGPGDFKNVPLRPLVNFAYRLMAFGFNRLLTGIPTLWGSNMAMTAAQWNAVRAQVHCQNGLHEDLDVTIHLHQAGFTVQYDRHVPVRTSMRNLADRDGLWDYLQWWPQTLRLHGYKAWPLCWFFGGLLLYIATYLLVGIEAVKRRLAITRRR